MKRAPPDHSVRRVSGGAERRDGAQSVSVEDIDAALRIARTLLGAALAGNEGSSCLTAGQRARLFDRIERALPLLERIERLALKRCALCRSVRAVGVLH